MADDRHQLFDALKGTLQWISPTGVVFLSASTLFGVALARADVALLQSRWLEWFSYAWIVTGLVWLGSAVGIALVSAQRSVGGRDRDGGSRPTVAPKAATADAERGPPAA